jgi:nucleoside 2-deoxyribosyltransferase
MNPIETLVGLATQRARLLIQLENIDRGSSSPVLRNLERMSTEASLKTVEQNILDLLDSLSAIPSQLFNLSSDVQRMNSEVPFERSVFLMTKFPDNPGEELKNIQLANLTRAIEEALQPYGFVLRRADRRNFASSNQLWDNVRIHMLGCQYGIAVLESKYRDEFNPNVALEYGFMNALGRQVLLLVEKDFKHRRADIMGTLGKSFEWSPDEALMKQTVTAAIDAWMKDLGKPKIL